MMKAKNPNQMSFSTITGTYLMGQLTLSEKFVQHYHNDYVIDEPCHG